MVCGKRDEKGMKCVKCVKSSSINLQRHNLGPGPGRQILALHLRASATMPLEWDWESKHNKRAFLTLDDGDFHT